VWGTGYSRQGQLTIHVDITDEPFRFSSLSSGVVRVAAGYSHACAIMEAGLCFKSLLIIVYKVENDLDEYCAFFVLIIQLISMIKLIFRNNSICEIATGFSYAWATMKTGGCSRVVVNRLENVFFRVDDDTVDFNDKNDVSDNEIIDMSASYSHACVINMESGLFLTI
jgi:hypothetical protein